MTRSITNSYMTGLILLVGLVVKNGILLLEQTESLWRGSTSLDDALLDVTNLGDIVIDPFLGSGSGLIAAQNTGRMCRGVELDPLYITVIMRRFEAATGNQAILVETGEAFEALAGRRALEPALA